MVKKIWFFWGILLISHIVPVLAVTPIKAQPLIKLNESNLVIRQLCIVLQPACQGDEVSLWQVKGSRESTYYLIDGIPRLVKLLKRGNTYQVIEQWNFQSYQHTNTEIIDKIYNNERVLIYPALYPLNSSEMAVALIHEQYDLYSGGGASMQFADFLQLKSNGEYAVVFENIPFSSNSMIRACFTTEEYEQSPHCHDEDWMVLYLIFRDIGKQYYQWQFIHKHFVWQAFQPKNRMTVDITRSVKVPFTQK